MEYKEVIILTGEEIYLIDKFIRKIKDKWVSQLEEMNFLKVDTIKNNVPDIVSFMTTIPFMVDKKILIIENCEFLSSKKSLVENDEKQFVEYLNNRKDNNIIILNCSNVKVDSRKKIYKSINKIGSVIKYEKLKEQDLKTWIMIYLENNKRDIKESEAYYLSQITGYLDMENQMNLYDIKNELDKLVGYTEESSRISKEDIDKVVKTSIENNIFKLVDYICENKPNMAFEMIKDMMENSIASQYIFYMITRHFRLLLMVYLLEKDGCTSNEIINASGLRSFSLAKMMKQTRLLGYKKIKEIYEKCYSYDKKSKNGFLDIENGIDMIISTAKK
jgi:DNA polymerase-3 subunit delta